MSVANAIASTRAQNALRFWKIGETISTNRTSQFLQSQRYEEVLPVRLEALRFTLEGYTWPTEASHGPLFTTLHSAHGTVCVLRMHLSNIRANRNDSAAVRVYFAIHILF